MKRTTLLMLLGLVLVGQSFAKDNPKPSDFPLVAHIVGIEQLFEVSGHCRTGMRVRMAVGGQTYLAEVLAATSEGGACPVVGQDYPALADGVPKIGSIFYLLIPNRKGELKSRRFRVWGNEER